MKILRNIFSQLHVYVLWLLLSTMFWGWIFASFVNDTSPEKKVTIYVDAPAVADGQIITGRGPGAAITFALAVLAHVVGEEAALAVAAGMVTQL